MNAPSSITFNVGAPTFGERFTLSSEGQQSFHFCGVSRSTEFPIWNDASSRLSMNLKTNHLVKPSSNTLNVGAPTFLPEAAPASCRQATTPPGWRRYEAAVSQ
ncbi:MAG TPA: hypothetical protein VFI38_19420 [Candidatus Acidoferrum sp.]|nr:hypothetical protein [Candidatus Acidoferrum sp.]